MATAKKARNGGGKKTLPKSAPTSSEATVAEAEQPKAAATPKKKALAPEKKVKPKTYRITLIEGATLERKGHNFVAGRPLVTADEKLYEALKNNGRFRCDVVEGGSA
jgi:hypothetical protein